MQPVKRRIDDLKPDPNNLRLHGEESLEMLKKSLLEYGQYKPLVVDTDGVVRIGNGRFRAMKELGWKEAWCVELDFSKHTGVEVLDNRLAELSNWKDANLDDWLLSKGVDWFGVDAEKSQDLLKREKKKAREADQSSVKRTDREKKVSEPPRCPCCGAPLHKKVVISL